MPCLPSMATTREWRAIRIASLDSSSIAAAGYDAASRTLRLRYVGGRTYDYFDVPSDVYDDLLASSSKGQFVNWNVKPNYRYSQVH